MAAPVDSVNKIKHLERSLVAPPEGATVIHLEINETSDHAVLAWLDKDTQTLYYYSEAEKLYLNPDCSNMFSYLGVEYLDLKPFDSSRVTDMNFMFANMYNAKEIDFSHFSTSNVTDMGRLFWKSWDLKKLDLSSFDTSKVIYMNAMFIECYRLIFRALILERFGIWAVCLKIPLHLRTWIFIILIHLKLGECNKCSMRLA